MRRYLVVAHRTLGGAHLLEHVQSLREQGPCRFFLLVPVEHPAGHWTDEEVEHTATLRLQEGLDLFHDAGIIADGAIGDANPVYAITSLLLKDEGFDEIILSTLPPGPSRWLKLDVPSRVAKECGLPVTHVVAERESVGARAAESG
jgi:hypothetical protein